MGRVWEWLCWNVHQDVRIPRGVLFDLEDKMLAGIRRLRDATDPGAASCHIAFMQRLLNLFIRSYWRLSQRVEYLERPPDGS